MTRSVCYEILLFRLLTKLAVHQIFHELDTLEFQKLGVRFDVLIQRHADFPGFRIHLGIGDRRLIPQHFGTVQRVTLDHVQIA